MPMPTEKKRSLPPTTTVEQDLKSHGQRRINLIWEVTQGYIAVAVTTATVIVGSVLVLRGDTAAAFVLLSNAFFLVIGFYFGRTNHARAGDDARGGDDSVRPK